MNCCDRLLTENQADRKYYSKDELAEPGLAVVDWENIDNVPPVINTVVIDGGQADSIHAGNAVDGGKA